MAFGHDMGGVRAADEVARSRVLRDVRSSREVLVDVIGSPPGVLLVGLMSTILIVVVPGIFDLVLAGALTYLLIPRARRKRMRAPFRLPKASALLDNGDRKPGSNAPQKARGIAFFGNRVEDGAEIWAAGGDLQRHQFIIGTTGAGKTEGLVSQLVNAFIWASGLFYCDGKGDVTLFAKIFSLARIFGREDDVLVLNFMTGNADTTIKRSDRLSNTYNPFSVGSASSLTQLLVNLMDASDGKGDMWKGRAISFIATILPCLVDKRDFGGLLLHVGTIRQFMPFVTMYSLLTDPQVRPENQERILAFLKDVPGFQPGKGLQQAQAFFDQYGFQQMQFTRILSSLADTYGHIFKADLAEVALKDAVVNRRILITLLPALELSRPELGNLGKIVVAGLKGMMGAGLGNRLEGTRREIIESRATNAPTPYLAYFDEFGYYMPEDAALMWAQARSLNFSLTAAGQDLQAFYRTSKEETLAIVSNCSIKQFGKLEDPKDTFELIDALAGKSQVAVIGGYEYRPNSLTDSLRHDGSVKIEKVERVTLQDLKEQVEGEVHMLINAKIIRAAVFYADPPLQARYRINHFMKVRPPTEDEVKGISANTEVLLAALMAPDTALAGEVQDPTRRDRWWRYVADVEASEVGVRYVRQRLGLELGIAVFQGYRTELGPETADAGSAGGLVHRHEPAETADDEVFDANDALDEVDVFSARKRPEPIDEESALYAAAAASTVAIVGGRGLTTVRATLLEAGAVSREVAALGASLGGSPEECARLAREAIQVASIATAYPPTPKPQLPQDVDQVMGASLGRLSALLGDDGGGR